MKKLLLLLTFVLISSNLFAQAEVTERLRQRMQSLNPLEYTRTMVLLRDHVDIYTLDAQLYAMNVDLKERARIVITTLQNKANSTQGPILTYVQSQMSAGKVREYIPFWITNMIYVDATPDVLLALSQRNDVAIMDYDEKSLMDMPVGDYTNVSRDAESVENGLRAIKADSLWMMGYTGVGRTVMHIDTGVDGNHVALSSRWWGNNGRPWWQAWFDPIAPSSTFPFDCGSHGTHTMGIMTGRGANDTVGVAPDARWMSAGVTDCPGASYPTMNIAAYQWAMNPDSNAGTNNDMPDAISCSWQDPSQAGSVQCNTSGIYALTLTAIEAAGIGVVFSAGNSGPGASTITPPKNLNLDSVSTMSVGNVDGNNVGLPISNSSSRGPSTCGGTGTLLIKPEVVAPGTNVRSTLPGNTYGNNSGTSMASPHVAGAIALLRQVAPNMTGKQIKAILFTTARDLGTAGEDNTYGRGVIDLMAAFRRIANYPLNSYNLQSPAAGITLTSLPGSPTVYTFNWDTSATGASYKWIFGSPNATNRQITLSGSSNVLTVTSGQLDAILAGLGVAQGGQLVGQWDVWAFRPTGSDSMKATNGPRSITLRRGTPVNTPVNLISPATNTTIVTSVFNTSNVEFKWSRSSEGISYKWMFDSPNFSGPVTLSMTPGNNGFDTSVSVVNSSLDAILGGIGLNPGDSLVGQWRVYGYRPTDSAASNQTFNLTLKRQAKGDVIVLYDSTVANCRISKDSIIAGLNSRNVTYDLFNRAGNTSTNGISLRGYKKVILLGEGTSVASNRMKDSIKAYLASGGTSIATKSKLIIFAEDVGYHWGRTGSTYLDADFANNTLGFTFVSDRPTGSTGPEGLIGDRVNAGLKDSTSGPWPDVLAKSTVPSLSYLYAFTRVAGNYSGVGRMANNFNVATFAVDFESLKNAVGGASGSPQRRWINAGLDYVDQITPTNIEDPNAIPTVYELKQNFPNPFNPVTKINFAIPKQGFVTMKVYDVTGRLIAQLVNEMKSPGYYSVDFNATNLASGVYFYRLESKEFVDVKRMMLIK
ncbi:MAG TPA: S8 family serine peptidase [Ignavibacteria bacterium]|nr:S8 family serine peptidase [Ignavibacteria bacterium]